VNRRGRTPGLKSLVKKHLGYDIQLGEHDPVEDARAALYLYLKEMKAWEEKVKKRKQVEKMMSQMDGSGDYNGNDNVSTQNRYSLLILESRGNSELD